MGVFSNLVYRMKRVPNITAPMGAYLGTYLKNAMEGCCSMGFSAVAEDTNAIVVNCQAKDGAGNDCASVCMVELGMFTSAALTTLNTNDYTIAAGTDGELLQVVADKILLCTTEADGDLDISFTISGASTIYLALFGPTGKVLSVSGAITHV